MESVPFDSKPMNHMRLGAASKLVVAADLMAKGYHVFRALSSDACCDLVAIGGGAIYRVEVKTITLTSEYSDKRILRGKKSMFEKNIGKFDVLAVVIRGSGEIRYISDFPWPTG